MAREIVTYCDPCMDRDERAPARTFTVDLDGTGPKEVDLCSDCSKVLDPIQALLLQYGTAPIREGAKVIGGRAHPRGNTLPELLTTQRRGKAPEGPRAHQCPFCPMDYAQVGAFTAHCKRQHGFSTASLKVILGRRCPLCGMEGLDLMGQHGAKAHGVGQAAAMFQQALAEGDQYGVVAARTALATNVIGGTDGQV